MTTQEQLDAARARGWRPQWVRSDATGLIFLVVENTDPTSQPLSYVAASGRKVEIFLDEFPFTVLIWTLLDRHPIWAGQPVET